MANGIRTIYSPRQRMAPGQYESPLADFLDNLPGYISQFQQNQLALGQQQLEDKRYEDAVARQARLDALGEQRYTAEQQAQHKKILADRIAKEKNEKRDIARDFIRAGHPEEALPILNNIGDTASAIGVQAIINKTSGMNDSFEELRGRAGSIKGSDVFAYKEELDAFRDKYDIDPGDNIDRQLVQIEGNADLKIIRQNQGMIPVKEWESMGSEGRSDYRALLDSEKNLSELRSKKIEAESGVIQSKLGGPSVDEMIQAEKETIRRLQNKKRYKLETESEYRNRKEFEKKPLGALLPPGTTQEEFYTGVAFEDYEDYTPSSDEDLADLEDKINKQLDKVVSAPTDDREPYEVGAKEPATEAEPGVTEAEKKDLGMPSIFGLPTVQAGQPPLPDQDETNVELFPKVSDDKPNVFNKKVPSPKLRDARYGIKYLRNDLESVMRDEKMLSDGLPNKTSEKNMRAVIKKKKDKLRDTFLKIYDKNSKAFYDDDLGRIKKVRKIHPHLKNTPMKYREYLTDEEFKYLISL